jgi:cytochrome c-type biogenesis protein CcmH
MRRGISALLSAALLWVALAAAPVWAVQPDEILPDPVMEVRARDISAGLRCLVCRNESIDESNADLARDLRLLVRERLLAGDTNDEVVAYVVDRFGEYVLLRPTTEGANILLWIAGPVLFLMAFGGAIIFLRQRASTPEAGTATLSEAEKTRLREIMGE